MNAADLDALVPARLTGDEPFHAGGKPLGFELLSFWRWACSNVHGNALRGLIAEYLVAQAADGVNACRTEWDACDVTTPSGLRIEVKTSAYVQSWKQTKLSAISFDIAPKRAWDAATNTTSDTALRTADGYVFALHAHQDKRTADPLDVLQWEFYVLPAAVLNERCALQKTIGLGSLLKLRPTRVGFSELGETIARVGVGLRRGAGIVGSDVESSATGANGAQQVAGMMPVAADRAR